MTADRQGFPDDRDRELQRMAERTWQFADDLVEWAGQHVQPRRGTDFEVTADEEFALYRLRRLASNLWRSANVPVAAAVYGPSQVGKSLFMARVLEPAAEGDTPLGKCDQTGPPSYIPGLSFEKDINPHCGDQEATALVTRFTTKERFDETALPEYPVKVRALTRAEWLRVLARGFRSECIQPKGLTWREDAIRALFESVSQDHAADAVDRDWRMDLLDVYAYVRGLDPRLYEISESMFNAFLSRYPLTTAGYVELAGRMFWDRENYPELTVLFNRVAAFLEKVCRHGRDGILVHWAALRFLLDSRRTAQHESRQSKWQQVVRWADLRDGFKDGWYVLDYAPGGNGPNEELAVIQSAMLEMIIPVIPHRLSDDWRDVILKMDVLDLPGILAGGAGNTEGGAAEIDSVDRQMNVVKRGKVFYLIDRYIEERQIQTLLLLIRGGNLNVRGLLKEYVDKWGQARYGEEAWPQKVDTAHPALFLGMTGIDEQFKDKELHPEIFDARLSQLVDTTFYEVMTDFGGTAQPFTNVYPIRYPGTWDWDQRRRQAMGDPQKWERAGQVFVGSPLVQRYVKNPQRKWEVAMRDNDGGLSLISQGFLDCTNSLQKQDVLREQIQRLHQDLKNLAERWYCPPDANVERNKRIGVAQRVLQWLEDEHAVYERVRALQAALCFDEGDAMEIAEFPETRPSRQRARGENWEKRFTPHLKNTLGNWARELATRRYREVTASGDEQSVWLPAEDFDQFARYLGEYLCSNGVFTTLHQRLLDVLSLPIADQGDRRFAHREYVCVILNDFITSPGPERPMHNPGDGSDDRNWGLMQPIVHRWRCGLAEALASAAGEHVKIPSGNAELLELLHSL
jgi:hypothetical protein